LDYVGLVRWYMKGEQLRLRRELQNWKAIPDLMSMWSVHSNLVLGMEFESTALGWKISAYGTECKKSLLKQLPVDICIHGVDSNLSNADPV
jgi:hypothetical protein